MKILAVGMNYPLHNKELNNTLSLKEPVIFTKPESAVLKEGRPFFIPDFAKRFDYETEIVVRINRLGKSIAERFAHRYYDEVTVGIDFTARDLQNELKEKGLPWDLCKGFDGSAAIGEWIKTDELGKDMNDLNFHLDIDGKMVQKGWTGDMIHSIDRIVAFVSQYFTLKTGDMIFTGTPAGVGPVSENQHLTAYLEDRKVLEFNIK
ncbi:MAG: fumarylacetoacetate hydrolase family protein [Prevotellaceae bacterium]|nr:fumarylacetoacetate hydrolase family protein [Candidatus Colivivens equi]MCQ2075790.1 fumarylacetoacetate hydrolase family protein [Bacteroidaceae bacterium]